MWGAHSPSRAAAGRGCAATSGRCAPTPMSTSGTRAHAAGPRCQGSTGAASCRGRRLPRGAPADAAETSRNTAARRQVTMVYPGNGRVGLSLRNDGRSGAGDHLRVDRARCPYAGRLDDDGRRCASCCRGWASQGVKPRLYVVSTYAPISVEKWRARPASRPRLAAGLEPRRRARPDDGLTPPARKPAPRGRPARRRLPWCDPSTAPLARSFALRPAAPPPRRSRASRPSSRGGAAAVPRSARTARRSERRSRPGGGHATRPRSRRAARASHARRRAYVRGAPSPVGRRQDPRRALAPAVPRTREKDGGRRTLRPHRTRGEADAPPPT